MRASDYDRFAAALATLTLHADKKLTTARIDLYWKRLSEVPIDVFEESIDILIDNCNGFPKIPMIRKACDAVERKRQWRADQYKPDPDQQDAFCPTCEDTGWVRGKMWAEIYAAEVACVRACKCRASNPVWRAKQGAARNALKTEGRYEGTLFKD